VTFIDLCGHEKYLKTTMFGLVGLLPDYAMIVIGANMGVSRMTREHLGIALALKIPIFIVITKIDIAPEEVLKKTVNTITKILKLPSVNKMPLMVKDGSDMMKFSEGLNSGKVVPIFKISNVTEEGLDQLKLFFPRLISRVATSGEFKTPDDPVEFMIDGEYVVTGVGLVVAGTLRSGTVDVGSTLLLGPDKSGDFKEVIVKGIHYKRTPIERAIAGQSVCFNIKAVNKKE
jgi:GTPase